MGLQLTTTKGKGMTSTETHNLAVKIWNWLSKQTYNGEGILHCAVCCDYAGKARFIKALQDVIKKAEI